MTALHLRDSPADLLCRPGSIPSGSGILPRRNPLSAPGSPAGAALTDVIRTSIITYVFIIIAKPVLSTENLPKLPIFPRCNEINSFLHAACRTMAVSAAYAERGGIRMNCFYFTFRSVTAAQRGQARLRAAGIPSSLSRTPAALSVNGCGYCLRVAVRWASAAARTLRENGMQRCFQRTASGYEEAECDLL